VKLPRTRDRSVFTRGPEEEVIWLCGLKLKGAAGDVPKDTEPDASLGRLHKLCRMFIKIFKILFFSLLNRYLLITFKLML
ncbi:MAG: hypothetical protein KDK71_09540, partial [Chlamydiia bacterium]|nr:hypothetical protein [Chlamydiia bacterium]